MSQLRLIYRTPAEGTMCLDEGHQHVFSPKELPPPDNLRCKCGAMTWAEAVNRAYARRMAEVADGKPIPKL